MTTPAPAAPVLKRGGSPFNPQKLSVLAHVDKLKCLLYGLPGAGKTTAAAHMPSPFILVTEPIALSTYRSVNPDAEGQVIEPGVFGLETARNVVRHFQEAARADPGGVTFPYKTLVVDSLTDLQDRKAQEILAESGGKTLTPKEYEILNKWTMAIMGTLRDLPMHVVVICGAKTQGADEERGQAARVTPALLGTAPREQAPGMTNLTVYAFRKFNTRTKLVEHRLLTDGGEKWITKGHANLALTEAPLLMRLWEKMQAPIQPGGLRGYEADAEEMPADEQAQPEATKMDAEALSQAAEATTDPATAPTEVDSAEQPAVPPEAQATDSGQNGADKPAEPAKAADAPSAEQKAPLTADSGPTVAPTEQRPAGRAQPRRLAR